MSSLLSPWVGRRLWIVSVLLLVGAWTTPADAQSRLVRSSPADGQVLSEPLRTVRVWFDRLDDVGDVELKLTGAEGPVALEGVHSMGENDLMATVGPDLSPGEFTLTWTAADGASGTVAFTVGDQARAAAFTPPLDIGVVLYDGAEPLDVFGPLEMWMNAGPELIRVHLIAEEKRPVILSTTGYPAALAPRVEAQYAFSDAPELDVLMVPGGVGTLREVDNERMIEFLSAQAARVQMMTSVCTGSALLARAGVLDGERATGNKAFFSYVASHGPETEWVKEARWVESGQVMTSSGVSAGIDMSLALIARYFGVEGARMIAAMTEYEWHENADEDPFVSNLDLAMPAIEALERQVSDREP